MKEPDYLGEYDPVKKGMDESNCLLSIIVPCRSEAWPTLCMTLQSIQEEARVLNAKWECIVVFNSAPCDKPSISEDKFKVSRFRVKGNFRYARANITGCTKARNIGLHLAVGKYVWVGDSHLILGHNLFTDLIHTFNNISSKCEGKLGILHSALGWMSGVHEVDLREEYTPRLKAKFWGNWHKSQDPLPHKICMSGTSYLMKRKVTVNAGGWNENFKTYGGGEPYINLKMWRLGYTVWTAPSCYVWHLAESRNYEWFNEDIWFNFMLAAYCIGGTKWLDNQFSNICNKLSEHHTGETLFKYTKYVESLREEVISKGTEDMLWIESHSEITLDELMTKYGWE